VGETTTLRQRTRWLGLGVIVAAQFMVVLDVSIVNVALPDIQGALRFSQQSLQWVITAYAILFGGFLMLGGRLGDIFGRRRLFATGVLLFTASSLLCGFAWSEGSLIAFRAAQGLGGAMLAPGALSMLMTMFSEGRERNIALGIWGAASGSGGAVGVLLGGLLTSYVGWSWIFFINVPVGVAVIALTPVLLPESRSGIEHRHFDVAGAASVTAGLMLLVYAMTRATQDGWGTGSTLGLLAGAASLLVAFIVIERRSAAPLLPMRMFRVRSVAVANAVGVTIAAVAFSQFYLLTLYMQQVLHYSAIQTGLGFLTVTLAIITFSNLTQTLVARFGVRRMLIAGLTLDAVGLVLYARLPANGQYFWDIFPALLVSGVGLAFSFVPMTIAALTGVRREDAGIASGLINTSRQIGGAVGLAAISTVATAYTTTPASASAAATASSLTNGFDAGFVVLSGVAIAGALIATALAKPSPHGAEVTPLGADTTDTVEEAA
jgi:EmrB/QacA subfamily drug resistance transporter